ncbi:hypothetical protein HF521_006481 [Silurus meridionalis]|uniref:Uncharacterized protein n=2 Tax=Silurus meridionalis TaxID=175797 RepID=A0A8T0ATD4_SILME|nr:hypothetical protein HF521_006481 [Silurus meridionalis]
MQQWEEQLQEVQRKIEELYKVVEARRGTNEMNPNSNAQLDITLLPVNTTRGFLNNGCHGENISSTAPQQPSDVSFTPSCSYGVGYQKHGVASPQSYSVSDQEVMMDILDGYLGVDTRTSQRAEKTHGATNTSSAHNHTVSTYQNASNQWLGSTSAYVSLGEFEEAQNRKNKGSVWEEPRVRHVSWRDQVTIPEKSVTKPPIHQRDSPHPPQTRPANLSDSPKCPLVDRRCGSPSVLLKFGAMLQENEGKTLIEDGIVTTLVPKHVPKSPRHGGSRGSKHVPVRGNETPVTHRNCEHGGAKVGVKISHWGTDNLQMGERILGNFSTPSPRNTPSPHLVSCDSSPTTPRRSFSRPARPAHQRPPSRWASHTPTAGTITPTIPRSRSLSPACKPKQRYNKHSLFTETIIM